MHTPELLGADEGSRGAERQAEGEHDGDRSPVEEALKGCKLCERHDKVPFSFLVVPLGEEGVSDLDSV